MVNRLALFPFFLMVPIAPALAEGISVYPTTLVLEETSRVGMLTLENKGSGEALYELAGYRWTAEGGADNLASDKGFIITPPVVALAPGEKRAVRVGVLPGAEPVDMEQAYRVRITELQSGPAVRSNALDVRLQLLLPVFRGGGRLGPDLGFTAWMDSAGQVCLNGQNSGDSHAKIVWVAPAGRPDEKVPLQKYVLAGSDVHFCVGTEADYSGKLLVGATSAYQSGVSRFLVDLPVP